MAVKRSRSGVRDLIEISFRCPRCHTTYAIPLRAEKPSPIAQGWTHCFCEREIITVEMRKPLQALHSAYQVADDGVTLRIDDPGASGGAGDRDGGAK